MDSRSQETLRRIQENDDTLTTQRIASAYNGGFNSSDGDDFSILGAAIGQNTNLTTLQIDLAVLDVTYNEFYDGLKLNSSISELLLHCGNDNIAGGVGQKILEAYQANNNLTELSIHCANLQNGGDDHVTAETLRNSTSLRHIDLYDCNITDEQLQPILSAVRGHNSLERLLLHSNRIGNDGCETFTSLLEDTGCNLQFIALDRNSIGSNGAVTLANGLANNTKLKHLFLGSNPIIGRSVVDVFSKLLCNMSSINSIYSSNHTLETLYPKEKQLSPLLELNKGANKSHVAIKKILKFHPSIDMVPLFEWNMEGEGERDLKALPYVVAWFDRAREAVADDEGGEESYNIDERKLSAIYQFAQSMPLLFVPASHIKGENNKRKRGIV